MGDTLTLIIIETGIIRITMSNNGRHRVVNFLGMMLKFAFGVAVLQLSVDMVRFGYINSKIDLAESSEREHSAVLGIERSALQYWSQKIGYRIYADKILAEQIFSGTTEKHDLNEAKDILNRVLELSPFEPAYWLQSARIGQFQFEPNEQIISKLRLSYVSGRGVQWIMDARFQLAMSVWPMLDDSDKVIAMNDLAYSNIEIDEELDDFLNSLSSHDFARLAQQISLRAPSKYPYLEEIINLRAKARG